MFSSPFERRVWAAPAVDLTAVDAAIAAILTTTNGRHPMTTTQTTGQLATEALAAFEARERDNGETYLTTRDDAADWIDDMVRAAHGDMLPDDHRYSLIHSALEHIADLDPNTESELDDAAHEWADGMVDVYTADRLAWLASHLSRPGYVDTEVSDLGVQSLSIIEQIGVGQYAEAMEVWAYVVRSLAERWTDLDES